MIESVRSRITAFWLAWKWVLLLLILLALSVRLNIHQWKQAITAPLRAEVASKEAALDESQELLTRMRQTAERLEKAGTTASTNITKATRDFEQASNERPLAPQCAPGRQRMDAVNRALGASSN